MIPSLIIMKSDFIKIMKELLRRDKYLPESTLNYQNSKEIQQWNNLRNLDNVLFTNHNISLLTLSWMLKDAPHCWELRLQRNVVRLVFLHLLKCWRKSQMIACMLHQTWQSLTIKCLIQTNNLLNRLYLNYLHLHLIRKKK